MSEFKPEDFQNEIDEEMTVTINLDDGDVTCRIITILSIQDKDYIVLCPMDNKGNITEEVWFYGYKENPDDPNEEPELIYIEDDDEYDAVADKYDEFLDNCEFDEMD